MKASEVQMKSSGDVESQGQASNTQKPQFRPAQDDTKPPYQDPVTSSCSVLFALLLWVLCNVGYVLLLMRVAALSRPH